MIGMKKPYKAPSSMIWKDLKAGTSKHRKMKQNDAMGFKAFRIGVSMRKMKRVI
jgi:hypothetical protein